LAEEWLSGLTIDGVEYAVHSHLRTAAALKDKTRWSLVAVPHDVTGPPVDITNLVEDMDMPSEPRTDPDVPYHGTTSGVGLSRLEKNGLASRTSISLATTVAAGAGAGYGTGSGAHGGVGSGGGDNNEIAGGKQRHRRALASASAWADGAGAAESLYWVAYGTQPSKILLANATMTAPTGPPSTTIGNSTGTGAGIKASNTADGTASSEAAATAAAASRRAAQAMLGEVDGKELLTKMSKEYISVGKRREQVKAYCVEENKRLNRLANMFTEEVRRVE
jgi:hypothetical protein